MNEMDPDTYKALREPFQPEAVGILPKPYKKDSPKGNCDECGGYHGLPAAHLSYVGHAAVTDRLLQVDNAWTWEPLSYDEEGLPAFDRSGGLWIKLTIAGVTRLGYGDAADSLISGPKVIIGDAIRNAAMRFGVALELWTKDELESLIGNEAVAARRARAPRSSTPTGGRSRRTPATDPATDGQTEYPARERNRIIRALKDMDVVGDAAVAAHITALLELDVPLDSIVKLTYEQGVALSEKLGITAPTQ